MKTVESEARIKVKIRKVLQNYSSYTYYYMPVPGGYGRTALDYLGFCCGLGFAIEAKSTIGNPTDRQLAIMQQITAVHVPVFVIRDDASLAQLDYWLNQVTTRWRANHDGAVARAVAGGDGALVVHSPDAPDPVGDGR